MILVILPSKNEASNIRHITQVIDCGLTTFFPRTKALILNIDSISDDGTVEIFNTTHTKRPKHSLVLSGQQLGKGHNVKAGIQFGLNHAYRYFLTLDTDVTSATPRWIHLYLRELINERSSFVCPLYLRNRFEGNTTNHFSSPLVYSCWSLDIKQPIAGDFGFNATLAKKFVNSFFVPSDFRYGVDTLMTWTALASGAKISQIQPGKKIHSPSLSKIKTIFSDVSYSTFYRVVKYKDYIIRNIKSVKGRTIFDTNILPTCSKPSDDSMSCLRGYVDEISVKNYGSLNIWCETLADTIVNLLVNEQSEDSIYQCQNRILPYYFCRVINYLTEICEMNESQIANQLAEQNLRLFDEIRQKYARCIDNG